MRDPRSKIEKFWPSESIYSVKNQFHASEKWFSVEKFPRSESKISAYSSVNITWEKENFVICKMKFRQIKIPNQFKRIIDGYLVSVSLAIEFSAK